MNLLRSALLCVILLLPLAANASLKGSGDFVSRDGIWLHEGRPFFSSMAHAIHHKFRNDREGALEDLKRHKEAGFTIMQVYWAWHRDLQPDGTYNFSDFDDFVLACKELGIKNFAMFLEYNPQWFASQMGWSHTDEEGNPSWRINDMYVCDPTYVEESRRFYMTLLNHLKENPEISENILYWNIGGEYAPFKPHRQPRDLDYGYDEHTVTAFREWMQDKGWTLVDIAERWGTSAYDTWDDVWPSVNMHETDYKGRDLANIGTARWDWYDFRQEVSWKHIARALSWIRSSGDRRPFMHEYNIVTPGGALAFLRWSRVGARDGGDGVHLSTGTFDREFDYHSLLFNLSIARGASDPPWQSNEQKGNTTPEWMRKHAWLMLGMGGTGLHFWEWRSDDWGVVRADGSEGFGYPEVRRLNAEFDFLGDLLAGSRPMPNRIGVLALSEDVLWAPRARERELHQVHRTLLDIGSGMETAVLTDDEILYTDISNYKLIISPGQIHMRKAIRERLAEWVRQGGTLWLTPGSASRDETGSETQINPGSPLDEVAGVMIGRQIRNGFAGPLTLTPDDSSIEAGPFAFLTHAVASRGAKPVAWVQGHPAIWRNEYGKGFCYMQAAYTAYLPGRDTPLTRDPVGLAAYLTTNSGQLPASIITDALFEQENIPYAWANTPTDEMGESAYSTRNNGDPLYWTGRTTMVGVRDADPGYLLVVVEGDNRQTPARVHLNTKRLGIDSSWRIYEPKTLESFTLQTCEYGYAFDIALKPAEVRILHLVPGNRANAMLTEFRQRDWSGYQAQLPAIPETELIPPTEIGRIDPGDIASIHPEPYGDGWLLLDLSRHANRSLVDEGRMEQAKAFLGSVGVGDNDLSNLPTGIQELLGIPFNILDPDVHENSCLITKTVGRPWLGPLGFEDIPVRERVKRIHWLYGTGWAPDNLPVGYVTYHYADGTTEEENLICTKNIANWWGYAGPSENPRLRRAWEGSTPAAARNYTSVGLYHYYWDNPHPDKVLESISITSYGGDATIITVAITAEKAD